MESDYPSLPSYPPLPPPVSEEPSIQESSSSLTPLSSNKPPETSSVSLLTPVNMSYNNPTAVTQLGSTLMSTGSNQQHSSSVNLPLQPTPSAIHSGSLPLTSAHLVQHMALHSLHQPPLSSSGASMSDSGVSIPLSGVSNPISGTSTRTPNIVGSPPMASRSIPIGSSTAVGSNALASGTTTLPGGTPPNADNTLLRLHYLEQLCGTLTKEKKTIENNFGRQRKKFMNHILQSDATIAKANSNNESLSNEVRELSTQLLLKDEEVKDIRMASKIMESQAKEAFDADRVKYEEEIASLRQILTVQTQEHESSLMKEREQWQKDKDKLIADLKQLKAEEVAGRLSPGSRQSSPVDSLETSMAKAALDAQILRSVVVPLEKEVVALKKQLAEKAKEQSTLLQGANGGKSQVTNLEVSTVVGDNDNSLREEQSPIPNGGNKLQHQLELERSARHDLEMHATQVETQKSVLQEEVKILKVQLERLSAELATEMNAHNELKKTWELANQHFIVIQDKLKNEIYRLHQKLERGESASPLKQLPEFEIPQVLLKKEGGGDETIGAQMFLRTHRRSLSTKESSETNLLSSPQQPRSSSCNDIHTATVAATSASYIGDFAMKVTSLQTQLDGVREELARRVAICEGYEKQLLRVQEQMVAEMDDREFQIDKLKAELEKYKAGIMRERKLREEMRKQIDGIRDEIGTRIETFQSNECEVKQQLSVVKDKFTEITQDTQREIVRLNNERGRLHQQMESAQEEYDCLKVLHAQEMKQLTEMKTGREEAELNLKTTMEQFSSLQSQASAREENLRKELTQTMDYMRKERNEIETRWRDLVTQLEKSKQENAALEGLKQELVVERRGREEAVTSKQSVEIKSKLFIASQQQQMEALNKAKESAEQQVRDLQRQLSQLKHQLSHTEETQKDFVELSQSLQMRLAEIEDQQDTISPSPT